MAKMVMSLLTAPSRKRDQKITSLDPIKLRAVYSLMIRPKWSWKVDEFAMLIAVILSPGKNLSYKKDNFGLHPELTKKKIIKINTKHSREYKYVRVSGLNQDFLFLKVERGLCDASLKERLNPISDLATSFL